MFIAWARAEINITAASPDTIIDVKDDVRSWKPGDRIVIASTDWDPKQAEEFDLKPCPKCSAKQVKIKGITRNSAKIVAYQRQNLHKVLIL